MVLLDLMRCCSEIWYHNLAVVNAEIMEDSKECLSMPSGYLGEVFSQIDSGAPTLGEITSREDLDRNFEDNAIPASLVDTTVENYHKFLQKRRSLMAAKLREYYGDL